MTETSLLLEPIMLGDLRLPNQVIMAQLRRSGAATAAGARMRGCVFFLLSCYLLMGCASRQPATPTSEAAPATVPGAKTIARGMSQAEALRRLHSAGAMEVPKDVLPNATGWAVAGSQDCLFLSISNGTISGINVEGNSNKPKMYRTWHSTNSYSLP